MTTLAITSNAAALFTLWLFASSGVQKLRPAHRFYYEVVFTDYGVRPAVLARRLPLLVGAVEILIGAATLWLPTRPTGALAAIALLVAYALLMGWRLLRDDAGDSDCGCAGPAGALRLSGALLLRNILAAAVIAFALVPQATLIPAVTGTVVLTLSAALACAMIAVYASAEQLLGNAQRLGGLAQ